MKLSDLIEAAISAPLRDEAVASSCVAEQMDRPRLYEAFARNVADGSRSRKNSWTDADVAINHLFSYAYAVTGEGLSDYALLVYEAFDEGEHQSDGQSVTDDLLSKLDNARI